MNTKKIYKLSATFALSACVFASASCDVLDIMQDNRLSASNMWTESSDVLQSTYGIYERMRSNFAQDEINVFYWGEARVGDYMWGPSLESRVQNNNMIAVRTSTMDASTTSTSWSALYTTIDQANAVLKYAPKVEMTENDRSFAIGQAAFARAYCYFWAARLWGDVPLNLVPIESVSQPETYPERAPKADVYAQIGADIQTAVENADNLGTDKYFATKDAVNMLKAEYALWMYSNQNGGDSYLSMASEALSAIGISSSRLLSDYASVFSRTNKANSEVIFALLNDQREDYRRILRIFLSPGQSRGILLPEQSCTDQLDPVVELFPDFHRLPERKQGKGRQESWMQSRAGSLRSFRTGTYMAQQIPRGHVQETGHSRLRPALLQICPCRDDGRRAQILQERLCRGTRLPQHHSEKSLRD